MDCKLVPYGESEKRCVKCGYITWNNEKSDKEIIDDMIAMGYPVPNCRENATKCECGANTSCQCGPEEPIKDLEYWKNNADEDYISTPISVLRYISELEKEVEQDKKMYSEEEVKPLLSFIREIKENWDCDDDAHKYNTICRCCDAEKTLYEWFEQHKKK